ncbi:MAG: PIN domain-containing protein [Pseudomonadota bacterium]
MLRPTQVRLVLIDDADVFLDTNVLVYAACGAVDEPEKWQRARAIVAEEEYCTSAQVLAEFYVSVTRSLGQSKAPKRSVQMDANTALRWISALRKKPCQPVDARIVESGITNARKYQISYWDGAIIAAAQRLGVATLYSEDLDHGQAYDGVTVINPFREP